MGRKNKLPIDPKKYPDLKIENPEKYYNFGDEIGTGKLSIVKECTNKTTNTKYAAKIIKYDSESLKFAIREYELMWKEKNSLKERLGTVKMHEAFMVQKYLVIIMELVDGKTLLDKVSHMHSITEDDIASFIRQLCTYLDDWHKNNILHLDLRPTNIRFASARELKILDYNSCRHIANKKAGEVVDHIGDTEFCAPEMLMFEPVLPGSDMWTIGVLAYTMLSGISPFYYEDETKVVDSVQNVKWSFDENAFSEVTHPAKDFIQKCFIRIPENRLSAEKALAHPWLSKEHEQKRKNSALKIQDSLRETDERLLEEEEEEYIEASCTFRTFEEEAYNSPVVSDDEE